VIRIDGSMKRPVIGISCELKPPDAERKFFKRREILVLNRDYALMVERAGGVPILLPVFEDAHSASDLLARLDGLILSGGGDVIALEESSERSRAAYKRSFSESVILDAAARAGIPILGICRGMQQINVFHGGTLWDDLLTELPGALNHQRGKKDGKYRHEIVLQAGSQLSELLGCQTTDVNSSHHQAVKEIGHGLHPCAVAKDGVVEALESDGPPIIWAVQWHPERLGEHPAGNHIFDGFVSLCANDRTPRLWKKA
jgi:putative glutamine amidotransferase